MCPLIHSLLLPRLLASLLTSSCDCVGRLSSQLSAVTPPGFLPASAAASPLPPTTAPAAAATTPATVSVPLPSDVYGAAPSLYIPLPARHFSSMSKSELALIIKLQLSQLQNQSSDSHHNDTFYSAVMEMRTKGRVSKSLQQLPPILHHRQQSHSTSTSTSTSTAGGDEVAATGHSGSYVKPGDSTLGRLQSSSLKKPKKLMELASADQLAVDGADDGRSARQDSTSLLQLNNSTRRSAMHQFGLSATHLRRVMLFACVICFVSQRRSGAPRRKLFGSSRAIAYLIEEGHASTQPLNPAITAISTALPRALITPRAAAQQPHVALVATVSSQLVHFQCCAVRVACCQAFSR